MKFVKLGSTGLDVSPLALGCMSFGDREVSVHPWIVEEDEARVIIAAALDAGINFFDTANIYAAGTSERVVGSVLKDLAARDEIVVATKVRGLPTGRPNKSGLSRKAILTEVDASLQRLGLDHIDLYQIHGPDRSTPWAETMQALHDVVVAGKVRYLGACNLQAWDLVKASSIAEQHGWTPFSSVQSHYNAIQRDVERELIPMCAATGVALLPWSPLARGRLARPWSVDTTRITSDDFGRTLYRDVDRVVIERVESVATALGRPMAQVALAWVNRQPQAIAAIVGATKPQHVADAVAALDLHLEPDAVEAITSAYIPR